MSKELSPAIGLDIGTSRIVLARKSGEGCDVRSQLNAFVPVPFTNLTEKSLKREGVPHTRKNGSLVIHGNESERFADLLGLETRRPMRAGVLNPSETEAVEVIRQLVELMLDGEEGGGRPLYFSIPAAGLSGEENLTYHEATIKEMMREKGFEVTSIPEGLAVIYGELEDANYTGIGISCGGGLCNVCLAYLSVPLTSFSVPKGGDFIDSSAASVSGEVATRVRIEKESGFHFNGGYASQVHQALNVYYDEMIRSILEGLKKAVATSSGLPKFKKPVPLALSGGTVMPEGFAERFEKELRAADIPVPIAEVRMAKAPLESTARGALVAALADC